MAAVLRAEIMIPGASGADLAASQPETTQAYGGFVWLWRTIEGLAAGFLQGGRARVQLDTSTAKAASGTVTLTQASLTAGDVVGLDGIALTAVAGTATASAGTWSKDTSNAAAGISLAAAINGYPATSQKFTATDNGSGVVTITARTPGSWGNSVRLSEVDGAGGIARSGSTLSGGLDESTLTTVLGTFSGTGTANDTITIGGVTLTLVASAANENQITIGGSAAASATNTIAVINAHSKLKGFVLASSGGSAIVSLQLLMGGRIGNLVGLTDAGTGFSWASTSFTPATTEAWAASPVVYALGGTQ